MKTKIGKYYQIGDKHVIKADKVLRIETNLTVTEHAKVDTLPKHLKEKIEKKQKNSNK